MLADRMACAARFLSDQDFTTALDTMARSLIANGKKENILQGLLLTGTFFFFIFFSLMLQRSIQWRGALVANGKKENILQASVKWCIEVARGLVSSLYTSMRLSKTRFRVS
jgi:hypothetical protein